MLVGRSEGPRKRTRKIIIMIIVIKKIKRGWSGRGNPEIVVGGCSVLSVCPGNADE